MSDWIKHDGKGMPVSGDTIVDFKRRIHTEPETACGPGEYRAGDLRWMHADRLSDITHYRIVKETDNANDR